MKNAYIITNKEMVAILGEHLKGRGFDVSGLTVRFTATNAVVAGIYEMDSADVVESFDDEDETEADWDSSVQDGINEGVRELLEKEPHTVGQLAVALDVSTYAVQTAIESLGAARVAPARENGATVSKWMCTGTAAYDAFVTAEKARVDQRVEEESPRILGYVPQFHERAAERPEIVEAICAGQGLDEDAAEALRRDAKAVFYRMAELGTLEHIKNAWRAGKTEIDTANVTSLQGAVREVLMASDEGLTRDDISAKLPGNVQDSLLRHAIKRMDDVYEQGGLLFHSE